MSAICRRSWPNMSAISTTGARIHRWDNGRLVHRYHARLIETLKLERSSRYLCSEVFITFISNQHDDGADLILAPYNGHPDRVGRASDPGPLERTAFTRSTMPARSLSAQKIRNIITLNA